MPLSPQKTLALVAPQRLPGLEKFPEAERSLLAALNAARVDIARAAGRPVATNLKTTDYLAREEEYVRAAPASGGMTLQLPKATRQNLAARITVLLESVAHADLVVQAIDGTVNTASSLTLGAIGRVDFISNGETGWFSERSLAGSTSIVESGGEYQLAAGTGDVTWAQNSTVTTISALANAKLAQMATATVKGRALGAGTGDPTDLTAAQLMDLLEPEAATWTGNWNLNNRVRLTSEFSQTLTGNTDDLAIGAVLRVRLVGNTFNLTGMVPNADGHLVWLQNADAADALVLVHDATSTAANRFYLPNNANYTLQPRSAVWAQYDGASARWYIAIGN
jgi:hypothetical protein